MASVLLFASLWLAAVRAPAPRPDDSAWKLRELHDPFPAAAPAAPLPPEERLKLPELKPLDETPAAR